MPPILRMNKASSLMNRSKWVPIVAAMLLVVALGFYLSGGLGGGKPGTGITVGSKAEEISLVGLNGESFVLSEHRGEVVVLEASEHYKLLARNQLPEGSYATPAVAHGRLYFRTFNHLICVNGEAQ